MPYWIFIVIIFAKGKVHEWNALKYDNLLTFSLLARIM